MDENPKISLIIPAYNEEKYIGACLEHAVKNSGRVFFEIIVIDNASSDLTEEIARKYSGVRVVREGEKGLTRARQRGFKEAKGDIIAYIDADTRMPSGWAKIILQEFKKNPRLASLSGPYIYYDLPPLSQKLVKIYWGAAKLVYLATGYMAIGGNFAVKKNVLEKMGGFDTSIEFYGEDTDLARRAAKFGKVKFMMEFAMPTSARRFRGQGLAKTAAIYAANFISEAIFKKPATREYKDIR